MTNIKILALVMLPLAMVGCQTNPSAALGSVQKTVADRTGQTIVWPRTIVENDMVDAIVAQLVQTNLTVDAAVRTALLNNRALRANLEEIGISRADVLQAGLLRNPKFFASIRFPDRPPSGANTEFSLVDDFLDMLLLPLKKKIAAAQFEQTELRVSHEILQLAADVKSAFYTAQARQQLGTRLQAVVELNEAGVDLSTRQHNAGNITDLELATQQASFQQAKLEWVKTQSQLRVDRERLNRLLGLWGANTQWNIGEELPPIPATEISFGNLESLAIKQRLDLAAAQRQAALVRRALSLRANTRYLPAAINMGVDTEHDPNRQNLTGPTLEVEIPIFDHGQGAVARLQAQYRQAQWQVEARATDIRSEVREARDTMIAARDLAEFYSKIYLPQRIRIVNETLLQYNAMQKGTFELMTGKERELDAEREYTEAWRDYWIARAGLERAVGGRLPEQLISTSPPKNETHPAQDHQEPNARPAHEHKP